jgi:CPA1 family monovalent cation:H+ antiporter
MSSFALAAAALLLAAVLGTLNYLYLRLPRTIALMAGALVLSIGIIIADRVLTSIDLRAWWDNLLAPLHLPDVFLNGLLAFLLFAASLHVDMDALRSRKWIVLSLSTVGVLLATAAYGGGIWFIFGYAVPLPWCCVLGAILAPTDPIAVGGLLRDAGLPPGLLAIVDGESLFNDGVAVVIFTVALGWANGQDATVPAILIAFLREAGGGILLGLVTGALAYSALRLIDEPGLELTITLALVTVTYSIANALHISGPLAVVVAGLLTGHHATRFAMSDLTREQVLLFWDLVDELLNAVLFLMMGFALLTVHLDEKMAIAGAAGIVLALVTRLISVCLGTAVGNLRRLPRLDGVAILTWGGLRGGISIALVLTLTDSPYRGELLGVCYAVVVWTILVQGLTMPALVRRLFPPPT